MGILLNLIRTRGVEHISPPHPCRVFAYISATTCMSGLEKLPKYKFGKRAMRILPHKVILFCRKEMELGRNTRIS